MTYDPYEHIPTPRRILAAWLVCLALVASGLGFPALWGEAATLLHHRHEGNFAQYPAVYPAVVVTPHRA